MTTSQKFVYEGLYAAPNHLTVCMRVETGGIPRFENLIIHAGDVDQGAINEVRRWLEMAQKAQGHAAPWVDEPLPGIG